MSETIKRKFLSRQTSWGSRRKVYEVPAGLEIDEFDQYDIVRKRVFFDDVMFVTYHRFYGASYVVLTAMVGALFLFIAAMIMLYSRRSSQDATAAVVFMGISLIGWIPFALRLLLRVDCITVYGKRSKAQMHFQFRKARAREIYADLCEKVRQTHEQLAAEIAAEAAQHAAENPPPAPPGPGLEVELPPAPPDLSILGNQQAASVPPTIIANPPLQ